MRCISAVAELNRESSEPITTIALYAPPDAASWFVREASDAIPLGPAAFAGGGQHDSGHLRSIHLDPHRLLAALAEAQADAVWVGWRFVAEPAELARLCEGAHITVIGPGSDVIGLLRDTARARQLAGSIGIPVVADSGGAVGNTTRKPPAGGAARNVDVQGGGGGV